MSKVLQLVQSARMVQMHPNAPAAKMEIDQVCGLLTFFDTEMLRLKAWGNVGGTAFVSTIIAGIQHQLTT